ncbi:MAG: NAD(P)/FAD-dependent oxidoreductase [Planctomycetota bacterium]
MSSRRTVDVVVIGGGAAGMMAATVAARAGSSVRLLEKNQRPGLKILISGGGRCNLTTTREGTDLERQYGARRGRWLRHALRAFPPRALRRHVEDLGVPLREEDLEKIFTRSGKAADVVRALVDDSVAAGGDWSREDPMLEVRRVAEGFEVESAQGLTQARAVVLATGGLSYPKTGATGDGYRVTSALGHGLVPPVPALAPLRLDTPWLHELQGLVLDAELALRGPDGAWLVRRRRPTLVTHRGLSGPGPMDVSGYVEEVGGGCTLVADLVPEQRDEDVEARLLDATQRGGRRLVHHGLPDVLPERLRAALRAQVGLPEDATLSGLTKQARRDLVASCKRLALPVNASLGFGAAEVTRGGVPLEEVDARTMESRVAPGLFLCGEILDVDGPIGGFNFQAAFATGRLAGLHAAARTRPG